MQKSYFLTICLFFLLAVFSCQVKSVDPVSPSKKKTFVILGSSTAAGAGASSPDSSWVGLLTAKFKRDQKDVTVVNLAVSGYTTYHIVPTNTANTAQRPAADTNKNITRALSYKPDFIIINLPSNDFAAGYAQDEILKNYQKVTVEIGQANIQFLITSTQPRNFGDITDRKKLKDFNPSLRAAYPTNVIDFYDNLADASYLIKTIVSAGDGIHLNNAGHRLIYEEFFKNKLFLAASGY